MTLMKKTYLVHRRSRGSVYAFAFMLSVLMLGQTIWLSNFLTRDEQVLSFDSALAQTDDSTRAVALSITRNDKTRSSCSGGLVGPALVLTASHCVMTDGELITSGTAYIGAGAHGTDPEGLNDYLINCDIEQALFAPEQNIGDGRDWALLRLGDCYDPNTTDPILVPSEVVGYYGVEADQAHAMKFYTYFGYPTREGYPQRSLFSGVLARKSSMDPLCPSNSLQLAVAGYVGHGGSGGVYLNTEHNPATVVGIHNYSCTGGNGGFRVVDSTVVKWVALLADKPYWDVAAPEGMKIVDVANKFNYHKYYRQHKKLLKKNSSEIPDCTSVPYHPGYSHSCTKSTQ